MSADGVSCASERQALLHEFGERYREALRAGRDLDLAMESIHAAELRYAGALRELDEATRACAAAGVEIAQRALGSWRAA
ncbi:MAG: hypothetical protein M3024_00150 [Candidatus Dormibacteraeota bacterium]|nr:hypothetical protein [Candidatus Dormibacteraeota bacterium]